MNKEKMEKIIFVRRFLRLKRAMCFADHNPGYKAWVKELLQQAAADGADGGGGGVGPRPNHDNVNDQVIFQDRIEPGEKGKINGKEPGEPVVTLRDLKRDNAAKSWLYEKYVHMHFVDKNPYGGPDDPLLEDETQWEHRVITNVVWHRHKGYTVLTSILGATGADQEHEKYFIAEPLLQMIRDSPNNTKLMASQMNAAAAVAAAAPAADAVATEDAANAASAVIGSV